MDEHSHSAGGMSSNQKKILAVIILGTLMSAVDVTIVLLAIPQITSSLHTNLAASIWVIIVYLLVVAILTTQLGRIGDIYGRGKIFNIGFIVFTIGSGLCGISSSIYELIFFRIIQAIGGAMLQANSGALIADTFERHNRGMAYGYTSLGWSVGAMLGIVLGGVLTTFLGWPYIFYINIPVGIAAIYYGFKYIKDNKRIPEKIDKMGVATISTLLLLTTLGATAMVGTGPDITNVAMMVVGLLLLPVFILVEKRSKFPTINLKSFKNRILANSLLASFFQSIGYLSITFIIIMYLQGVRGLDPLNASLLLIPGYVMTGIVGPKMGKYSDRFGARLIATLGVVLMISAIGIYYTLTSTTPYYIIIIATIISGTGAAMFFPANSSAVMANAQEGTYGAASGVLRMMGNIGTLGSYVLTVTIASLAISRDTAFKIFLGTSNLTGNISTEFVSGLHTVFIISAILLAIAAFLSISRGKEQRHQLQSGQHWIVSTLDSSEKTL